MHEELERLMIREGQQVPENGMPFELSFNADDHDVFEMVRRDGLWIDKRRWRHVGTRLSGMQTARFQLVALRHTARTLLGIHRNLLRSTPNLPQGQWREAFKLRYPYTDGHGVILLPDFSWLSPRFPAIRCPALGVSRDGEHWHSDFFGSDTGPEFSLLLMGTSIKYRWLLFA